MSELSVLMTGRQQQQQQQGVLSAGGWKEPARRHHHSTAVVGEEVYLWAGEQYGIPRVHDSAEKQAFLSSVEVFNVNTGCWEQRTTRGTPPLGVWGYSCVAVRNDLYYFGGECGHKGCYHNSVHTLSTSTLQWRMLASTTSEDGAPMKKSYCGVVHFTDEDEDLLFVVGGYGPTLSSRQRGAQYKGYMHTNEQHIFCLSTSEWNSLKVTGQAPPPCSNFTLTTVGEKRAALFGGWDESIKFNHLFIAELGTHSVHWSNISTSIDHSVEWPLERGRHAATHLSGPLFVIVGGVNQASDTLKDIWLCDTTTKLWKKLPLPDEYVAEWCRHSVSTLQLGPHCMWLVLFGGWYYKADTVIIELIQRRDGEWSVGRILERDTLSNNTVYQDMLREGRKKGLMAGVAGRRTVEEAEQEIRQLREQVQQLQEDKRLIQKHQLKTEETLQQVMRRSEHLQQQLMGEQVNRRTMKMEEENRGLHQQEKMKNIPVSGSEGVEMAEHEAGSGGGEDPSSLELTTADVIHAYDVSLRASKEKEQQLQSQLATVEQESQGKEQQLSKLEDEHCDLQKKMVIVKYENEQQQEELKRLQQKAGEDEVRVTASKEEQQRLLQVVEQWQRMGCARDIQISQLQNENELVQDKYDALKAQLKAASNEKQSVDTVDTGVQANYLAVAPGFLRGVKVYGETVLEVVGDKPQKLEWPDYGFYIEVPDGALASGVTASVGVKVILSGQFKLPDNRQLISAIYWISSSQVFLKEVAINIQHFAVITSEEQCSKLSFIIAKCSQELPYTFHEKEGSFNPHTQYGAIKLKQFSLVGETSPEDTELRFTSLIFYKPIPSTLKVDFIFAVVCNLELFLEYIRQKYVSYSEDNSSSFMLVADKDMIVLDLPNSPVDGWKIQPLTSHPEIARVDIVEFKCGRNVPACTAELEWTGSGEPKPLSHQVKISGAKKPTHFYLRYFPQAVDTSPVKSPNKQNTATAPAIENNVTSPSPRPADQDNPLTKRPKIRDLLTQVASKARDKWERVGLALGIKQDQLNAISEKRKDVILCYSEVFTVWEKTVDPADFTWATIVEALESPIAEENKLASDIVQWLTR